MESMIINEVEIKFSVIDENVLVPIKPICEVLGVNHSAQVQTLQAHPIYGQSLQKIPTKGADGKTYQMLNIPIKYFFGWIFSIDARKVKPEASEIVLSSQQKVYDAMYDKFFVEPVLQKKKLILLLEKKNQLLTLENERREVNAEIKNLKLQVEEIKDMDANEL